MTSFRLACFAVSTAISTPAFTAEKVELVVPEPAAVLARLKPGHPRLFATAQEFVTLKAQVKNHPRLKGNWQKFVAEGEKILKAEPSKYEIPDGKRLLATSVTTTRLCVLLTPLPDNQIPDAPEEKALGEW